MLTDKLDLRRGEESIALSNLRIYYLWKNIKNLYPNNKFKISALTYYQIYRILYQIFKINFNIF